MPANQAEWETNDDEDNLIRLPYDWVQDHHKQFTELLVDRIGDDLRVVLYYNQYDIIPYILHEEQCTRDIIPRISKLHRRAVDELGMTGPTFDEDYGTTQVRAAIHEKVAVLCFQERNRREGLIATLDYHGGLLSVL